MDSSMSNERYERLDDLFDFLESETSVLSQCGKIKVGAFILNDQDQIMVSGFNNQLPGRRFCRDQFKYAVTMNQVTNTPVKVGLEHNNKLNKLHHVFSKNEIHAERDALYNALIMRLDPGKFRTCLCTLQPCLECFIALVKCGVKEIYWKQDYDKGHAGEESLIGYINDEYLNLPEYKDIVYRRFEEAVEW